MIALLRSFYLSSILSISCFIGHPLSTVAQTTPPLIRWQRVYGTTTTNGFQTAQPTTDGGYIIGGTALTGISGDKTQVGYGESDYWIIKIDANGTIQWDRTFGGNGLDALGSLQQTADGGYILGGQSGSELSGTKSQRSEGNYDYWVVKLDANGNKQWDRTLGGTGYELLQSVRQTADGGYLIGGYSESGTSANKTQASYGMQDYWIVKLNAQGIPQWDRSFGGTEHDYLTDLCLTSDGGYFLGGSSVSGPSGVKSEVIRGSFDYWVLKLDANGNKQWDRTFGGNSTDLLQRVRQTVDGGYFLAGFSESVLSSNKSENTKGGNDYWVLKLDANGNKQWDRTLGGSSGDELRSMTITADGGFLLGGGSYSGVSGDKTQPNRIGPGGPLYSADYWLVKLSAAGLLQWDRTYGGPADESVRSIEQTSDGGYLIGGSSSSGMGGDKTQSNRGEGEYNSWIIRLDNVVTSVHSARKKATLQLYPNPTHSTFTIRLAKFSNVTSKATVTLLDTNSRIICQQQVTITADGIGTVQLNSYPAGVYWVRLEDAEGTQFFHRLLLQ